MKKYIVIMTMTMAGAGAAWADTATTNQDTSHTTMSSDSTYDAGAAPTGHQKKTHTTVTHRKTRVDSTTSAPSGGSPSASDTNSAPMGGGDSMGTSPSNGSTGGMNGAAGSAGSAGSSSGTP